MCHSPNMPPQTQIHIYSPNTHIYLVTHTHITFTHISIYAYIYPHIYTHIHSCIYTYTYAHMHAHTHTHIPRSLTLRYLFPVFIMHQVPCMKLATWEAQTADQICYGWFPGQHSFPGQCPSMPTQVHLAPNKSDSFMAALQINPPETFLCGAVLKQKVRNRVNRKVLLCP